MAWMREQQISHEDLTGANLPRGAVNAPVTPCGLVGSMLGSMG